MAAQEDIWNFDFDPVALKEKYLAERDRRLRGDRQQQYITIGEGKGAKYSHWLTDPWTPLKEREPMKIETTVLITGAGFSGIQLGAKLKQAGIEDFKILDAAGNFGGTWYWNRYPGAACDSEDAMAPEILRHCWRMATHFKLYDNAVFQTSLKTAEWDDKDKVWRATTDRGDTIVSKFLVTCGGPLNHPHLPDVEGIDSFKGKEFHTARWDYGFTGGNPMEGDYHLSKLADKTVAIIGTGATAIQAIPYLGESCKKLYVFQRTPSAIDVRDQKETDPEWYKSLPKGWQAERDYAFQLLATGGEPKIHLDDGFSNSNRALFSLWKASEKTGGESKYTFRELMQLADFKHMERIRRRCDEVVKDKRTAELLKPWYNLYCKRPVYSDLYLPTFNRPNVELVDTSVSKGIEKITPDGIVVDGKEYKVDVIIWSTGFTITGLIGQHHEYRIVGRTGLTMAEKFEKNDGFATKYGVATSELPNYFMVWSLQTSATMISHIIATAVKKGLQTVECTREAEEAWTEEVLSVTRNNPRFNPEFAQECTPDPEGDLAKLRSVNRAQFFGAGALAYRKKIDDFIANGELEGFAVSAA
ncbi:putative monooxygenase [Hyaloraphidium curvatum]|nr:putative monooxygenase [Hyaloraphidium curvatum]